MGEMSATIINRPANYNYFVEDTLECGIELRGNEVKSLRIGKASIKESWVNVDNGELFIKQLHITPWGTSNQFDVDPLRPRKLLAHKSEITWLNKMTMREGYTLIPLRIYFDEHNKCKVLIGVCKGRHDYDKRETQKAKDAKRDMQRAMKNYH